MVNTENTAKAEKPVKIGTKKVYKKKVPKIYFGTRTHKQVSFFMGQYSHKTYTYWSDIGMKYLLLTS